jgi:hypothetical protein
MSVIDQADSRGYLDIIHDEYRTALMNKKYYGARLERFKRINRLLEIAIALGATTGTGVAGLAIWKQGYGTPAWAVISGLAIILSAIKPILDYPKQIERYAKLAGEYAAHFETLRIMQQDINASRKLTTEQVETFNQVRKRSAELAVLDDAHPNASTLRRAFDEVKKEIPPEALWMPAA